MDKELLNFSFDEIVNSSSLGDANEDRLAEIKRCLLYTSQGYKIMYTDENGSEVTKQFDATEYTEKGQFLYNDITSTLEEFGGAISSDEKRQILFRILKELI